ncbi:MAG: bifunctional ornithine acetyltransferase/N-acetylglutamate synthase [Oscillospiraceae bacterium]|nr:bifunctional ornithine acetyltransferase/N-acetylglutamate synthase [Oscillospiraceae bacterium]
MQLIPGGVCAPLGFKAAGIHAGLKKNGNPDLGLIVSDVPAVAAATYTRNIVQAAPLHISRQHLADGRLQAVIINSGNSNACAPDGEQNALAMCAKTAEALGIPTAQVAVASTGVIGVSMTPKMEKVYAGIETLSGQLSADAPGADAVARSIMTTDLTQKEAAVSLNLGGKTVRIGAIAKGSGMIHPNMGTMLCFITTDAAIAPDLLQQALRRAVDLSFNRISVDGDTSTNDFCLILANGKAETPQITDTGTDYTAFEAALTDLCVYLARAIAADGEGATHLITCNVHSAPDEETATQIAKSVIASSLVKSAIFGRDANWGRILCAAGYSGASFDPELVSVAFASEAGEITVCRNGRGLSFDEDLATKVLTPHEIEIRLDLAQGNAASVCWGCDLTYDYVKINGDYRS